MNVPELSATIKEKGTVKEFSKFGRTGRVCDVILSDETGEMHMPLWDEQIDEYNTGDQLKIINGSVKEYKGEIQISV